MYIPPILQYLKYKKRYKKIPVCRPLTRYRDEDITRDTTLFYSFFTKRAFEGSKKPGHITVSPGTLYSMTSRKLIFQVFSSGMTCSLIAHRFSPTIGSLRARINYSFPSSHSVLNISVIIAVNLPCVKSIN